MGLFEIAIYPLLAFVALPWLTLAPTTVLGLWWMMRARGTPASTPVAVAAVLWLLYSAWEISFLFRSVREWIRVDLLLIAPLLLLATIWAIVSAARNRHRPG